MMSRLAINNQALSPPTTRKKKGNQGVSIPPSLVLNISIIHLLVVLDLQNSISQLLCTRMTHSRDRFNGLFQLSWHGPCPYKRRMFSSKWLSFLEQNRQNTKHKIMAQVSHFPLHNIHLCLCTSTLTPTK